MKWRDFENRLVITATLVAQSGLRIGQGGQPAEATASDLPVMKDKAGRPFIPGSSLRGALRSHVERIVRAFESEVEGGRGACNPLVMSQEDEASFCTCVTNEQADEWRKKLRNAKDRDYQFAQEVWNRSCRICRVFGSTWLASRVRLSDLICVNSAPIETRDGVAINREKETAENKYDFEAAPVGSRFALEIIAESLDDNERGLLWLGIEELRRGQIHLGGFKGRGLGRVELDEVRLRFVDKEGLREYLVSGDLPELHSSKADDWLAACVASLGKGA